MIMNIHNRFGTFGIRGHHAHIILYMINGMFSSVYILNVSHPKILSLSFSLSLENLSQVFPVLSFIRQCDIHFLFQLFCLSQITQISRKIESGTRYYIYQDTYKIFLFFFVLYHSQYNCVNYVRCIIIKMEAL